MKEERMQATFAGLPSPNGHLNGEVASALQKAIRRGDERSALYWATELEIGGYGNYVWKRLRIIASEDVGLADPMMCVKIRCLYENYVDSTKEPAVRQGRKAVQPQFLVQAVLMLARAPKSRMVDHAAMVMYWSEREPIEVPDEALDRHTAAGKRLKRGFRHFFDVGSLIENETDEFVDVYAEEARALFSDDVRPKRWGLHRFKRNENGRGRAQGPQGSLDFDLDFED